MSIFSNEARTKIYNEVESVLRGAGVGFSREGVQFSLDRWEEQKAPLIELMRTHPDWNEEALACIFKITEARPLDQDTVYNSMIRIKNVAGNMLSTKRISEDDYWKFHTTLERICGRYKPTIETNDDVRYVRDNTGVKCTIGQKMSKVVGSLCRKFGIDKYDKFKFSCTCNREWVVDKTETEIKRIDNKNRVVHTCRCGTERAGSNVFEFYYAQLADALSPNEFARPAILSVHPCDYFNQSWGNSWNSCHRIGGEYQAGILSYLGDISTMVFYTIGDKEQIENNQFWNTPKITRQLFAYDVDRRMLLQSRMYPDRNNTSHKMYRDTVHNAFAAMLELPNGWKTVNEDGSEGNRVGSMVEAQNGSLHYPDYTNSSCWPSLAMPRDEADEIIRAARKLRIGGYSHCLNCEGNRLSDHGGMHCSCDGYGSRYCSDCGDHVDEDDLYEINGSYYCRDCCDYCDHCECYVRDEMCTVTNRRGHEISVCDSCLHDDFRDCDSCNELFHVDTLNYVDGGDNAGHYCQSCFDDEFHHCYDCGDPVAHDAVIEIEDELYCSYCAEAIQGESESEVDAAAAPLAAAA